MGTRSLQSPRFKLELTATVNNRLTNNTSRSGSGQVNFTRDNQLTDGVSETQANRAWEWTGSLASGGVKTFDLYDFENLDLGAGNGNDVVGQVLLLEEIVAIVVSNENAAGEDGILEIEPASTNGWAPIGIHLGANGLGPQGMLAKYDPSLAAFDITDGSSHRIKLTANGGAINYKIAILGRSDDEESSSSSSSQSSSSSSSSSSSASSSSSSSVSSSSLSSSSISTSSSSSVSSSSSSSSSSSISTSSVSSASSSSSVSSSSSSVSSASSSSSSSSSLS